MSPNLQIPDIIVFFSHSRRNVFVKFHILRKFRAMALQSRTNEKIDLHSEINYRNNNKTFITDELKDIYDTTQMQHCLARVQVIKKLTN